MTATPGHLLIVDDDNAVTETFARMLMLQGFSVRTANSAEHGLREADGTFFDAIVLDLRMPFIDGLEFIRRLRTGERHRATPVMIVTGDFFLDDSLVDELRDMAVEVRFKPLWLEDLVDVAKTLLDTSPRRATLPMSPGIC